MLATHSRIRIQCIWVIILEYEISIQYGNLLLFWKNNRSLCWIKTTPGSLLSWSFGWRNHVAKIRRHLFRSQCSLQCPSHLLHLQFSKRNYSTFLHSSTSMDSWITHSLVRMVPNRRIRNRTRCSFRRHIGRFGILFLHKRKNLIYFIIL